MFQFYLKNPHLYKHLLNSLFKGSIANLGLELVFRTPLGQRFDSKTKWVLALGPVYMVNVNHFATLLVSAAYLQTLTFYFGPDKVRLVYRLSCDSDKGSWFTHSAIGYQSKLTIFFWRLPDDGITFAVRCTASLRLYGALHPILSSVICSLPKGKAFNCQVVANVGWLQDTS